VVETGGWRRTRNHDGEWEFDKLSVKRSGFVLGCLIILTSLAQAGFRPELGLKSGLIVSSTYGNSWSSSITPHTGFSGGVFFPIPLNRDITLQLEVQYVSRDFHRKYSQTFIAGTVNFDEADKLSYLEIPVLLKFPFPFHRKFHSGLYLGGSVAIQLKASARGDYAVIGEAVIPNGAFSAPIPNARKLDFGPIFGTDASFDLNSNLRIYTDFRMIFGLRNMFTNVTPGLAGTEVTDPVANLATGQALQLKHTSLIFSLGVSWR
jgi:hypothetical protein